MTWSEEAVEALHDGGVDVVAYLPDSVVAPLIEQVEADDRFEAVPVAREEEAVGILSGAWLGGRRGALVCQTSGLSNALNAVGSLSKPWGLPFVGIVSRRGDLGEHNLAQVAGGYGMPRILDEMGVRNGRMDGSTDVGHVVRLAADTAFSTEDPYVLLADVTMTGGKP
ncbi:decarboxylase [Halobacteriales archaeon QS_5_70_15]|nr:MAG: decarboxylase [Halobacteriales archaeon QS_5_70_15]